MRSTVLRQILMLAVVGALVQLAGDRVASASCGDYLTSQAERMNHFRQMADRLQSPAEQSPAKSPCQGRHCQRSKPIAPPVAPPAPTGPDFDESGLAREFCQRQEPLPKRGVASGVSSFESALRDRVDRPPRV